MTKSTGTCTTTATWDATAEYAKETASEMTTAEPPQGQQINLLQVTNCGPGLDLGRKLFVAHLTDLF